MLEDTNTDDETNDAICVNHRFVLSMIDGKILNAITGNKATQVRIFKNFMYTLRFKINFPNCLYSRDVPYVKE